jgi:hypothetical protein
MPTSFGSEIFADYRPDADATVIARLRAAGAVIVAKTTLPDWATSWFSYSSRTGVTKNPYDLDRDPGGSSSGTGAAIAAGYATVGLGTDCGGSVRLPSSFCNLVGVRSTPGLISRTGCNPLVSVQDTIGPMAKSVEDAARVFTVMAGFDEADPLTYAYSVARAPDSYLSSLVPDALQGRRIGVLRSAFGADDNPDSGPVNQVVEGALAELRAGGATLVDVTIDDLAGWIGRTSLYTIKSKHDINTWLASRPDAPVHTVAEIINSGRYHKKLGPAGGSRRGAGRPAARPGLLHRLHRAGGVHEGRGQPDGVQRPGHPGLPDVSGSSSHARGDRLGALEHPELPHQHGDQLPDLGAGHDRPGRADRPGAAGWHGDPRAPVRRADHVRRRLRVRAGPRPPSAPFQRRHRLTRAETGAPSSTSAATSGNASDDGACPTTPS